MIINCDTHGFGDIMTLAWIAEGSKKSNIDVQFYATGNKRKLLELLNQNVINNKQHSISLENLFPHDQKWIKKHGYSRINSWLKFFNIEHITIKQPSYILSKNDIEYANQICNKKTIILCPESIRPNREWPNCNWVELYNMLKNAGYNVLILCYRGLYFRQLEGYIDNLTWNKIFALFEQSKLVIGCDSAPIHVSGITNTKAIALLGPTTHHVFKHLPNVKCVSAKKSEMPCVGCWFFEEFIQDPCDCGCVALCSIMPKVVYNNAIKAIDNA